jgi:TatD DNase family protein
LKFILHCFSGSKNFAKECIKLNGYIAFGGMITFKKFFNLTEICKQIPLNKLLVETDSPYLSPHPFRGKVNHPQNTALVVEKISEIKQIKFQEISKITTSNFNELFKINCKQHS